VLELTNMELTCARVGVQGMTEEWIGSCVERRDSDDAACHVRSIPPLRHCCRTISNTHPRDGMRWVLQYERTNFFFLILCSSY
jgi:hypothetical protein